MADFMNAVTDFLTFLAEEFPEILNDFFTYFIYFMVISLVYLVLVAILTAWLAHQKGRNPYAWFPLGLVFGVIGVIALAGLPSHRPPKWYLADLSAPKYVSRPYRARPAVRPGGGRLLRGAGRRGRGGRGD